MGSSVILPTPGQPKEGPDPHFQGAASPSIVTFNFSHISPPSTVYIQRDDRLHVKIRQAVAGMGYIINARLLMPIGPLPGQPDKGAVPQSVTDAMSMGWINVIQQELFPTSNRADSDFDIQLAEGYLLSVSAGFDFNIGVVNRGQSYVSIGLQRGPTAGWRFMQLISDSVGVGMDLGWPGGPLRSPSEGPGFLHTIQQANPAAGADWTFTVPTGARMRLSSIEAQLAVANSGAARPVEIVVDDGVNIYARMATNVAAPINATANINFSNAGTPSTSIASDLYAQMPSALVLPPGHRVRSVTTNIVAGDQWSNIWFGVEEWINA